MLTMTDYLPVVDSGLPTSMDGLFGIILNLMLGLGIVVTLIGLMLSGIMFLTSRGDPKATEKAKSSLTYSILGMVLALGAFSVKTLIFTSLGVVSPELEGATPGF